MLIACAQINTIVGGFIENKNKIINTIHDAISKKIDILVFPECTICGYPPEDLLLKDHFIDDNIKILSEILDEVYDITVVIGFIDKKNNNIFNAAAVLQNKKIIKIYHKQNLPNYGVFDEQRYFTKGTEPAIIKIENKNIGITICEDIWTKSSLAHDLRALDIDYTINISASPYHLSKHKERESIAKKFAKETDSTLIYCNLVGGQDELVFDGESFVINKNGELLAKAKQFEEDLLIFNTDQSSRLEKNLEEIDEVYRALVLGTRDYIEKNGFKKVVLGLSGGIDSALVAKIACDALGNDRVIGISMPSEFSSSETKNDAGKLAENLNIEFHTIPIEEARTAYKNMLADIFTDTNEGIAEENLQARIRGNILMAYSNKFGALVLTTGNKSEIAVGYCTLYGDMSGGFAVIKDVPKTLVYKLAKNINLNKEIIPNTIITRAPSAELRPDQKDTDSLPEYEILDEIIKLYVEKDMHIDNIKIPNISKEFIKKIIRLIDLNEYKRRQSAPGVKITPKAFGKDRRLPITNRYNS